jgi:CelD/BcsL family acetyltransferase involved in cellulose biosynthesis
MPDFEIRALGENEFSLWDDFVDQSPQGSIYSKSFWLRAMSELTNAQFKILSAFKGGTICGGIGLCFRKTIIGNVVFRPVLANYSSIVLRKFDTKYPSRVTSDSMELIRSLMSELETKEYALVRIENRPAIDDIRAFSWNHWDIDVHYTYEVPLHDLESLKSVVAHSIHKQIRKCEEAGIRISVVDDCERFYSLYKMSFERMNRGGPQIDEYRFKKLYGELTQHGCCKTYFASLENGEAVSARIVLFTKNEVAHDWVAGADPHYFQTGATPFLLWQVIQDMSQQGYKYLDLNGANQESIAKFKSEFGGRLVPYYLVSRYGSPVTKMALRLRLMSPLKVLWGYVNR